MLLLLNFPQGLHVLLVLLSICLLAPDQIVEAEEGYANGLEDGLEPRCPAFLKIFQAPGPKKDVDSDLVRKEKRVPTENLVRIKLARCAEPDVR